jgi:hypothetical protein
MIIDLESREGRLLVTASGKASLNRGLELYKRLVRERSDGLARSSDEVRGRRSRPLDSISAER